MQPAEISYDQVPPPFMDFIERLKRHGFTIGVDHYFRVQAVLARFGQARPPEQLKYVLGPLFAVNPKQQALFYRLFDEYFGLLKPWTVEQSQRGPTSKDAVEKPPSASDLKKSWWVSAGAVFSVLFVLVLWHSIPPPLTLTPTTITTQEIPVPESKDPQQSKRQPNLSIKTPLKTQPPPELTFYQRYSEHMRWTGTGLPLIVLILIELFHHRRRRLVLRRESLNRRKKNQPYFWQIQVDPPSPAYAKTSQFLAASKRLRRRTRSDLHRLDVEKTIQTTILQSGFPTLQYKPLTQAPEYLFLIDLPENRNHHSQLAAFTAEALADEGLFVTRFFFREDPRLCFEASDKPRHDLADIVDRYRHCRLVIISSAETLLDPLTGDLEPWTTMFHAWPERAILTPRSPRQWGAVELALARQFILLPASLKGLDALRALYEKPEQNRLRPWADNDSQPSLPPADQLEDITALKKYFGDPATFQWLCACAVYPELHWNLTLSLGIALHDQTRIQETHLLELIRLPWFRQGRLPDELRSALIAELAPENLRKVRETIFRILENNPPPSQSPAYDTYRLYLAAYRYMIDPQKRKALKQSLGLLHERHITHDFVLLRFLESVAQSPLHLVLPKQLHKLFFKGGIPLFGLKTGMRAFICIALAALFFIALPRTKVIPEESPEPLVMEFAYIPPGEFTMGSPEDEPGRDDDEQQHSVTLTQGFYLQTTEVTQGQWRSVMGDNPSYFSKCGDDCPVERVSWDDIQRFIKKLNGMSDGQTYRLPTEAEWEHAARAGSTTAFANGGITGLGCGHDPNLNAMGWYCGNSGNKTHAVAQKQPNGWGLYDMHGNVNEWCTDWYTKSPEGGTNPTGPSEGSARVVRGGSWRDGAWYCRSAFRGWDVPGDRDSYLGFRLALSPGQQEENKQAGEIDGFSRIPGGGGADPESDESIDGAGSGKKVSEVQPPGRTNVAGPEKESIQTGGLETEEHSAEVPADTSVDPGILAPQRVRQAQDHLHRLGLEPGPVDGIMGSKTETAIQEFQDQHGLPATGKPDDYTLEVLQKAVDDLPEAPAEVPTDFTRKTSSPASPVESTPGARGSRKALTNQLDMTFAYIPPGEFTMGSPKDEPGRDDDEQQHSVTLTQGFYLQTTEVTQGQWRAVMGDNPSSFSKCGDNCPVESVAWDDVQRFIKKLNGMSNGQTYRLPTEAEWEHAARAGSTTAFANGGITELECGHDPNLDAMGWYCGNSGDKTHAVAQKQPNGWGLYDMHGNVWEWCTDWYTTSAEGGTNPTGPSEGSRRVVRGGGWFAFAWFCRSAYRGRLGPGSRGHDLGFRLALPPGQQGELSR